MRLPKKLKYWIQEFIQNTETELPPPDKSCILSIDRHVTASELLSNQEDLKAYEKKQRLAEALKELL